MLNSYLRLGAGLLLVVAAANSVWQTIDLLSSRRLLRTELAEIGHVRYGLLSADSWVEKIVPILDKQIDALDLTASNRASLKPTVINALNTLLDQVVNQLAPPPKPGAPSPGFAALAQAMMVKNMVGGLKSHIPEYADMVLKELGKPQNKKAVKEYMRGMLADGAKSTFGSADKKWFSGILNQNHCPDVAACQAALGNRIHALDSKVQFHYLTVLAASLLAFLLLGAGSLEIALQLLCCVALLIGGVLTPMLEVEAKISKLGLTFFNTPVVFPEQVLYYQSKSVLEVFQTLITIGELQMTIVAVLVLMFSVVFPILKTIAVGLCLHDRALPSRNRWVRFFALESSKWSMADVMALSIFMAFVAFNGVISSAMAGLKNPAVELVIPTDSSRILPGFYLFVGFCLASLWLAKKLERSQMIKTFSC